MLVKDMNYKTIMMSVEEVWYAYQSQGFRVCTILRYGL